MTLKSPLNAHVETPNGSLGDTMNQIRSWLDSHKIEPIEFKSDVAHPGAVALDIRFRTEDEASLFEQRFAVSDIAA